MFVSETEGFCQRKSWIRAKCSAYMHTLGVKVLNFSPAICRQNAGRKECVKVKVTVDVDLDVDDNS